LAQPLNRARPLWEMWLISGLADGRFAMLSKTHHSLCDGIAGMDIHATILDPSPHGRADEDVPAFRPKPEPNALGWLAAAVTDRVREGADMLGAATRSLRDPLKAFRNTRRSIRDISSFASTLIKPAPASDLNDRISSRRRYALARAPLAEVKAM